MKKNVGKTDKMIRLIVGAIILLVGLVAGSWWGLIGILPIITGSLGWCPAYLPFGISTCEVKSKEPKN